jgi:hypothetical protein
LHRGIDVAICHPKIVETGLDLLDFPTILFHETGYSLHTLRQASRRSWRIGQRRAVEVKFFAYKDTMQEVCLRLMGKKLLFARSALENRKDVFAESAELAADQSLNFGAGVRVDPAGNIIRSLILATGDKFPLSRHCAATHCHSQ